MPFTPERGKPTPPIALADAATATPRFDVSTVEVTDDVLRRLRDACTDVSTDAATLSESSRDWWPLAMHWALGHEVPARAGAVARPADAAEVAAVLRICSDATVPVTVAAGRSGVCGASIPVHGGVVLDLCGLDGIVDVDHESLVVDVRAGTFGDIFEDTLRSEHELTSGHWPQSIALSTVGGWLACRGAGQLSTRYGKIEDIVTGLDVVLADGRSISTGGAPRSAVGPDLTQLFVGSEGTLGVITGARLRVHPVPTAQGRAAYGFASFGEGLDACRRILRRGGTPAVLRLYDSIEANRSYETGDRAVLLVLDEADAGLVDATMAIVADECATAEPLDAGLLDKWFEHRNDVSALEALTRRGIVVDTMEIAGRWRDLPRIYERAREAILGVSGALVASAHQSHSYLDGACLYFTFAGNPGDAPPDVFYRAAWDAGTRAVLAEGGALSHHHGVGLNRARFVRDALGDAFDVLVAAKHALDPGGILNPGKLGLPDPWGGPAWP
ncbi:MAG: alkyldihydroxyacetonephosphate synthase [Actinomycetota bacterium]|jgi:alkyldihydroxyacetonephosphate synthase|nr:alkyldihydroxyacetonephosphate synthase [Actinomycetota bacterium]